MMKPANCKVCGKVFLKSTLEVCPDCIRKEQELIKDINDYCFGRDSVTLAELSKEFGESIVKLEKFLIDRKLVQVMDKLDLVCKACGTHFKLVSEGRLYCKVCFDKLGTGLSSTNVEANNQHNKPFYK